MTLGYSSPLYALPCDLPALVSGLFGWKLPLDRAQSAQLASVKAALYAGFRRAAAATLAHRAALVAADADDGRELLRHAGAHGFLTAVTLDADDGGADLAPANALGVIDELPTGFVEVRLVLDRDGLGARHERTLSRLRRLMQPLRARDRRLLVELRTPSRDPVQTLRAMQRLQELEIEPDVWRLEPLGHDAARLAVAIARRDGRDRVGCTVLVDGDEDDVRRDLEAAARTPGFVGFSVEPALLEGDVAAWRAGLIGWDGLVARVAARYRGWIDAFEPAAREASRASVHLLA